MLSQVEHGQSMPTITTLSRVAKGLGVAVERLLSPGQAPVVLLRANDAAWSRPAPGVRVRELSQPHARAGLRWFELQLDRAASTRLADVEAGDFVNLVVEQGQVELHQPHAPAFTLGRADASAFVASEPASLVAREPSTLFLVVVRGASHVNAAMSSGRSTNGVRSGRPSAQKKRERDSSLARKSTIDERVP